jgi:hypothetical protein
MKESKWTLQLPVSTDNINLLSKNLNATKENTEVLLYPCKEAVWNLKQREPDIKWLSELNIIELKTIANNYFENVTKNVSQLILLTTVIRF